MIRSIILAVLLLVVVLLIILLVSNIKKSQITDYYDTENRYQTLLKTEEIGQDKLIPFAADIAVVNEDTRDFSEMLTSGSGLLTQCSGGSVSGGKDIFSKMNPASTTKIMTALCALKYGNLDDQVVITSDCLITEEGASLAHIKPGQTYSLRQLMYGLMLPSGNDAANAIAIHIAGSVDAFVDMMNKEAESLGATDTHFVNTHGMTDEEHYTSAYDLYLIMNEAIKNPEFMKICGTAEYNVEYLNEDGTYGSRMWKNTNKYVNGDKELPESLALNAGKTGTTSAAGHCLVLSVRNENEEDFVSIVLKGDTTDSLYNNMDFLLSGVR